MDLVHGNPVPAGGLTFDGGGENGDSVYVIGSALVPQATAYPSLASPTAAEVLIGGRWLSIVGTDDLELRALDVATVVAPAAPAGGEDHWTLYRLSDGREELYAGTGGQALMTVDLVDVFQVVLDVSNGGLTDGADHLYLTGTGPGFLPPARVHVRDAAAGPCDIVVTDRDVVLTTESMDAPNFRLRVAGPRVELPGDPQFVSLELTSYGQAYLPWHGSRTLRLGSLSIEPHCGLELYDNELILEPHAADKPSELARARAYVAKGLFGSPADVGTITSLLAALDPAGLTTLAVADNDLGGGQTLLTQLNGLPVGPEHVLVKYTYHGDANLDGRVTIADYYRADRGHAIGLAGYEDGDFNHDDLRDVDDYVLIDRAFLKQTGPLATASPAASASAPPAAPAAPPAPPEEEDEEDGRERPLGDLLA